MMSKAGTIVRAAAAATAGSLLALALLAGPAEPAAAAGNKLLVSMDGVAFAPDGTLPLLARMGAVVPGDRSTEQVWFENDSAVAAVLRIDVVDPGSDDADLAAAFSLSLAPQGGPASPPVTIENGVRNGECTVLGGVALAPGERVRLDLTASVDATLGERRGQLGTVRFRLRGVLIEAAAAGPLEPGSTCQASPPRPGQPSVPGPGRLPDTGSGPLLSVVPLAGLAIGVGIVCCALAWRRSDPEDEAAARGDVDG